VKVELSLEFVSPGLGIEIAQRAAQYVDWVEIGTPMIKRHGIAACRDLKAALPGKTIVAAMKTLEMAEWEMELAVAAGADLVTVHAGASDGTLAAAVEAARRLDCQIIGDLMGISNVRTRARQMALRGVAYLQLCPAGDDLGAYATLTESIASVVSEVDIPVIVPGDVSVSIFERLRHFDPVAVRVGKSIVDSRDPVDAARRFREMTEAGRRR
jgi:3-hexulose-6-phosphate synthase